MHPILINPMLASGALSFAFQKATTEGKITICALIIVSIFSWTVIISKARQLIRARSAGKKFFAAYRATRNPLELAKQGKEFDGAPAYEVYFSGAEATENQLKELSPAASAKAPLSDEATALESAPPPLIAPGLSATAKIKPESFEIVRVTLEREAGQQAMALERGMIVLSTAVAGGPFIGLLGTVWGVMETFSGIAKANAASLTAMAPGVAGALIATVVGLFVAIPAMFAYNYMVTTIRAITQELDSFVAEFATSLDHGYVDHRSLAEELREALATKEAPSEEVISSLRD